MRLSDYKGEDGVEILADIFEPIADIMTLEECKKVISDGGTRLKYIATALKYGKKQVIQILARVEGISPEEYNYDPSYILSRSIKLLDDVLADEDLKNFFASQVLRMREKSSGSATENIEATETK